MAAAFDSLGIDFLLDDDGDLQIAPNGDLLLTGDGRTCLMQDCKHMLDTSPGDLFAHPEFGAGMRRLVGEETDPNFEALCKRAITDGLTYDSGVGPRIQENTIEIVASVSSLSRSASFTISFIPMDEEYTNRMNWVYALGWLPE